MCSHGVDPTGAHYHDAIGECARVVSIVCDVDCRERESPLQNSQFGAKRLAQFGIEAGKGLVQEEHARLGDERTRQGRPLLLSAR